MLGRGEDPLDGALLDDLAVLHHAKPIGDPAHDAEVMGDEQQRHAEPLLDVLEKLDDLRLHRDIERGGRLVGDQEVGLIGERHGDHDALALAAGQLMRIGAEPRLRIGNADLAEHLDDPRPRRSAGEPAMQKQNFADLLFDRMQRVERRHRLLEHDGDVVAAHAAHVAFAERQEIAALEQDRAGRMPRRRIGQQLEDRQRGHRFAGAGFADQRHGLAVADVERNAVDRQRLAAAVAEGDREVADGEQRVGGHASAQFSLASPELFGCKSAMSAGTFRPSSADKNT